MSEILEVNDVSAGYRDKKGVLKNVSFKIKHNEFFGLVGESGCGKSTLSRVILGLLDFEGSIRINGVSLQSYSRRERARAVQAVFQDPLAALNPRKTVASTMEEPLKIHRIGKREERKNSVRRMLFRVGLDESILLRYPGELSGGQRQRVCIGSSLMLQPNLVVADEAVSALDVSVGSQILNLFQKMHSEMDFSLLFISHNINVVYYLCDRIAVMFKGRIVEMGTADAVCNHPLHPYTRLLMSVVPDLGDEAVIKAPLVKFKRSEDVPLGSCGFYRRCPYCTAICEKESSLVNVSKIGENEHLVRCHHIYQL